MFDKSTFLCKTNPISRKLKLMQGVYLQSIIEKIPPICGVKTNPIQTQFQKGKNERFFAERELYFCFYNFTRETYHPKGCQN